MAKFAGYPYYVFAKSKESPWSTIGNAILSKYPIVSVKKLLYLLQRQKNVIQMKMNGMKIGFYFVLKLNFND